MKQKGHIKFVSNDKNEFFSTLKNRVEAYFQENHISRYHNGAMVFKTIIMLSCYLLPFVAICIFELPVWVDFILWAFTGIFMAGVGMSVMHDANHGAYSENKAVNTLLALTVNFCGGSSHNWKLQHNILHHTYTNITGLDDDIDDKLGMRFSPHTPLRGIQKLQFIYAFLFYGIITLYWCTLKDFIQFSRYTKNGVNPNSKSENLFFLGQLIFNKVAYFFVVLFLPIVILHIPAWEIITGFLIMHFIAGIILSVIFQMAHTVEGTTHPMPDETGAIQNNWAIHQMNTTVDFARDSKLISWYIGGLNFQVEHHLFPKICHIHYPEISKIVEATANEYGIPFLENKTFGKALSSHIVTLKRFGNMPPMSEVLAG